MGQHYLDRLIHPTSIAVIGASDREHSVGWQVFHNLKREFEGRLHPVNPNRQSVQGRDAVASIADVPDRVDLAVIVTPAPTVPEVIRQCGERGVRAALVISGGFSETGEVGAALESELVELGRRYRMRIVGPNCLGLIRPSIGLDATFSRSPARSGHLALISQSGALCAAIIDWAHERRIGFSTLVSLGNSSDVDFGDLLDYLALDPETRSILLYIEGVRDARRFMSGLRSAARLKPVVIVKAGRHAEGSRAAMSHTGALVGSDDVFDAAIHRAGAVRAMSIEQLFSAAQVLAGHTRVRGPRLAIVTNSGGPGVLAADRAVELGVTLPRLGEETIRKLDDLLPAHWSRHNPVDVLGDATPQRYRDALTACRDDKGVDGVLAILTPVAMSGADETAREVIEVARSNAKKPVLACWMGETQVRDARRLFSESRVPHFSTPELSVEAFSYLASYQRNQQLLLQVPPPLSASSEPDVEGARLIIEAALSDRREVLTGLESKALLSAFGIPVTRCVEARSATDALVVAESLGFPVAMKIHSPDITHKSDVGGVLLNIGNAQAVRTAFKEMMETVRRQRPDAELTGVTIEPMTRRRHGRELMIGVLRDPVFGPAISFGAGGTTAEVLQDRAVALPPLNRFIVERMIDETRIAKLLGEFRNMPTVDRDALAELLLKVSEMVCQLPELQEMDINPLVADEEGVIAVDARIVVAPPPTGRARHAHMAIPPYPGEYELSWQLPDGTDIAIRPIRPEDAKIEQEFVDGLSEESKYFRFMRSLQQLTPEMLVRFTQIDYDREMALIAVTHVGGNEVEIGVARYVTNPDGETCEFAIVIADEWHGRGIGTRLMTSLMAIAREKGLRAMEGEVLSGNSKMIALTRDIGFAVRSNTSDPGIVKVVKRFD